MPPTTTQPADLPEPDTGPEFDPASLAAILALDPDGVERLFADLLDTFDADLKAKRVALRESVAAADAAGIRAITHQLKSSTATFGMLRASRLARALEGLARDGRLQPAPALLALLDAALDSGLDWLAGHLPGARGDGPISSRD